MSGLKWAAGLAPCNLFILTPSLWLLLGIDLIYRYAPCIGTSAPSHSLQGNGICIHWSDCRSFLRTKHTKWREGVHRPDGGCLTAGTFLNGDRLEPNERREINPGNVLLLADSECSLIIEGMEGMELCALLDSKT